MSSKDDAVVTDRVCMARMEALEEKIDGLKTAIWAAAATIGTITVIVQIILTLAK